MAIVNLAIEIGSSFTSIYRKGDGLVLKEPSIIAVQKVGETYQIRAIGLDAKKLQGKTDDNTILFSPVVEGSIKSYEYTVEMLNYFIKKVVPKTFIKQKINAVVCVPCGISEEEKLKYENVCYDVKISKVNLVPSIICSILGSGKSAHSAHTLLVADLGGSCSDIATINSNSVIKGCTIGIGGRHIDSDIAANIEEKFGVNISINTAQKLKEEVGSLFPNDTLNMEITGTDIQTGFPKNVIITSQDIFDSIIPYLEQIIIAIETSINLCPPEIASDIAKSGILVTGGLAKLLGIDKYLRNAIKLPVTVVQDTDNSTILGAGKLLSDDKTLNEILSNF